MKLNKRKGISQGHSTPPWTNIQQAHYIATRNSGERDFATCAVILAGHVAGKRRTQNLPPNHVVPISMLSHVFHIKVAQLAQSTFPYVPTHKAGYISGWEWVRTRQRSKYKLFVDWFSAGLCGPKWVWSSFPIIYRTCPQRVIYLFFLWDIKKFKFLKHLAKSRGL